MSDNPVTAAVDNNQAAQLGMAQGAQPGTLAPANPQATPLTPAPAEVLTGGVAIQPGVTISAASAVQMQDAAQISADNPAPATVGQRLDHLETIVAGLSTQIANMIATHTQGVADMQARIASFTQGAANTWHNTQIQVDALSAKLKASAPADMSSVQTQVETAMQHSRTLARGLKVTL